jgi:hypothetical protein
LSAREKHMRADRWGELLKDVVRADALYENGAPHA